MLFSKDSWKGLADGTITVAFRRWRRPTVVAGRPYRTAVGRIEVLSVDPVDPARISPRDAERAGCESAQDVRARLDSAPAAEDADALVYRVEFRLLNEPDPRDELAHTAVLSTEEMSALVARLDRLDRASAAGPWTRATLKLIEARPAIRAPDLAAQLGRETLPFKLDVRKLKNLGLTESLKVGYRISPRGAAFLKAQR